MNENAEFAYDRVLYPNYLHPQTHPDRLATMTKFFGVDARPVEKCRVLELGCGTGSGLLSFAYDLPDSEFTGIDLSEKQIALGNAARDAIGLKNLRFLQGDITQINRENFGEFDYIIAHGLYSWVPDFVRDEVLRVCRDTLTESGVAFVSYNALPGFHLRQITRDLMRFHTEHIHSTEEKVSQSIAILQFAEQNTPKNSIYQKVLQDELKVVGERRFENIFHDDLSEFNHAVYFRDFAAHAARFDLQFVTEVEHFSSGDINYSPEVLNALQEISQNRIDYEQYLDFMKGRRFRQSLLCRRDLQIKNQPDIETLRLLRIASAVKPESANPELSNSKPEKFGSSKNEIVEINHPLTKAALFYLGNLWVRSVTFDELVSQSQKLLTVESGAEINIPEREIKMLVNNLFRIFCAGLLRLNTHEPEFATEVSEKPLASAIARWQAEHSDSVSTLLCTTLPMRDKILQKLLPLLDGTRDRQQITATLEEFINSPALDLPQEIKKTIVSELPEQLENNLKKLAANGLLIA